MSCLKVDLKNCSAGEPGLVGLANVRYAALLMLAVAAVVFYGLFRAEPFPEYFLFSDKVGHFLAFCLLIIVARGVFYARLHFSLILIPLLVLAVCSELVQASAWLPDRHYSIGDVGANLGGLFVGLGLSIWLVGNKYLPRT